MSNCWRWTLFLLVISFYKLANHKICQVKFGKQTLGVALTYNRNPERNKIMFMPFHLSPGILLYSLFVFHPPTYRETTMATTIHARIYACGKVKVSFAKFIFLLSRFDKLLKVNFSYFCQI
jgi:hypothetical protein